MWLEIEKKQIQTQAASLSQQMRQALFLLKMNAVELNDYLSGLAVENPLLEFTEPQDLFGRGHVFVSDTAGGSTQKYDESADRDAAYANTPNPVSLKNSLIAQLDVTKLTAAELKAAKAIIESLDSKGYFPETMECLEKLCAVTSKEAYKALRAVQSLDPAGVGARSLKECLCLQLKRKGVRDPAPYRIIKDYLEELSKGKYSKIAAGLHITLQKCRQACALIRELRPIVPDAGQSDAIRYVYPEVTVTKNASTLEVQIDEKRLPSLKVADPYKDMEGLDEQARQYIRGKAHRGVKSRSGLWTLEDDAAARGGKSYRSAANVFPAG